MVAGILQVLLVDSEVIFQLFPSDLFRWLDGLQVSVNMEIKSTAACH